MEGTESEPFRLLCPELTNPLEWRQATKALQALGEVVRIEKGRQMRPQAFVGLVVEAPDGGLFDRAVHAFDLPVRPGMIEFRQPMLDSELGARQVKCMGPEGLVTRELLPNLGNAPTAMRCTELKPVVRKHRVDVKRYAVNEPTEEIRRHPAGGPLVQFGERKLADTIDGNEQVELALFGPQLREIDVDVPEGIRLNFRRGRVPSALGRRLIPCR